MHSSTVLSKLIHLHRLLLLAVFPVSILFQGHKRAQLPGFLFGDLCPPIGFYPISSLLLLWSTVTWSGSFSGNLNPASTAAPSRSRTCWYLWPSATSSFWDAHWCVCVCVCQDLEQLLASQRRGNNWVTVPIYRDRFPSSCELFQAWRLTQTLFFSLVSAFLVVLRG